MARSSTSGPNPSTANSSSRSSNPSSSPSNPSSSSSPSNPSSSPSNPSIPSIPSNPFIPSKSTTPGPHPNADASPATTSRIRAGHVFLLLLAVRVVNALTTRTFFVPDEFYQALEPAWQLAFGRGHGAWITWEWRHRLRSSLHPMLFALVYKATSSVLGLLNCSAEARAAALVAAPKCTQALFAAALDFYTWRLAQRIFGVGTRAAWTILAASLFSPWLWYVSTRTLSNSLEATLTAVALSYWPWEWMLPLPAEGESKKSQAPKIPLHAAQGNSSLPTALLLAAIASILRPTNVLIWIPVGLQTLWKVRAQQRIRLIVTAVISGLAVAGLSALSDWWYYGSPTFPPLRFLSFNIKQDLAVFYGANRLDHYFTEGLPLMLLGLVPFALFGMSRSISMSFRPGSTSYSLETVVLPIFTWTTLAVTAVMSGISHKETRFILPLIPGLHILAGNSVSMFLRRGSIWKGFMILILLLVHLIAALAAARTHQQGVLNIMHWLRNQHFSRSNPASNTTVAVLMPCHSTPWRSHLIDPQIDAWALTCEPPIDVPLDQRADYRDEADIFYANPYTWMRVHMETLKLLEGSSIREQAAKTARHPSRNDNGQVAGRHRPWPQYVVFFQQLEPQLQVWFRNSPYRECARTSNSFWHDDWRRKGDVLVYCLGYGQDDSGERFDTVRRSESIAKPGKPETGELAK